MLKQDLQVVNATIFCPEKLIQSLSHYHCPRITGVELVNRAVQEGGRGLCPALEGLGFKLSPREEGRCYQELINIQANKSQVSTRPGVHLLGTVRSKVRKRRVNVQ